jgi:CheY-like chemotaxis protein
MTRPFHVLLVEDDRYLRKAAAITLRRAGFIVTTADDGEEAMRAVAAETPDLVLLDMIMPRMQGFEVLRRLKANAETASIPVIVLTNLSQDGDRDQAIGAGAEEYLVKANLSLTALAAAVERAATRRAA